MKKHLLFNQSFGTVGSPNQTDETQTRENRIGLMSYLHRTLMLLFAVLVMSMANIGMAWGTDVHYILVSKGYAPLTKKSLDASYNVLKTDGSTIGKVTSISSSISSEASLYYNSTSPTYANLTSTSNYGTSSGDNNTLKGINISSGSTMTISLGSQTFTKVDVIYRCNSSSAGKITVAGEEVSTTSTSVNKKTVTGTFTTSLSISATSQAYRVVVILTREYDPSYTVTYDANSGSGTAPSDANTYEADDPVTVLGKNTLSKSGYIFAGWNTAANGSGTPYSSGETMNTGAGNVTLHAQWDTEVDLKYVWKTGNNFCDDNSTSTTTVNMISENDYFTLTGTGVSQESGSSLNIGKAVGNYFLITAKSGYQISSICFYGKIESTNVNKTTDNSDWSGTIASTGTGSDKRYTFDDINSTYFGVKLNTADKGIYIRNMVITIAAVSSCTAPNHVDISGNYHFFPGETLALTATAYSTAGTSNPIAAGDITGYQWQKYIGSDWENIVGETSATYTKANATTSDVGQYRCIVSTGATCSTTSDTFNAKCLQLYVYWTDKSDKCNLPFTKVDGTHATVNVSLENGSYTYYYKVTDGCGNWWGNDGTMTSSNCSGWNLNVNNHCGLTTTKAAAYTFNLTYNAGVDAFSMSVVYPSTVQTGGYNLYFANDERNWSNIHYRIGRSNWNSKAAMTLVPGTANLYQTTTIHYESDGGFEAWHIANNGGWSDGNSIYKTNTGDGNAITNATRFEGAPVPSTGLTVIPGSDHSTGSSGDNNNCEFYSFTTVPGMWTHNVSITPPSHGTLTVNYTTTTDEATAFNSGNRDLAHTANYCVTAEEGIGYTVASITINGTPVGNRSWHVLTEDVVVAATFTLADYTITHSAASNGTYTIKVGDAAAVSTNTTANYGQTVTLAASPSEGYELSSWTVTKAGGGTVDVVSNQFSMPNDNVTITATFALKTYTITYNAGTGDITGSHANDTKTHGVNLTLPGATFSKTGYTQTGWATSDGGSQAYALSASYTANAAANLYPVWTAKTYNITLDRNGASSGSESVTMTYNSSSHTAITAPVKAGYTFDGWYDSETDNNGSGNLVMNASGVLQENVTGFTGAGGIWTKDATCTLYAKWTAAASLTAIECNTLYKVEDMVASSITSITGSEQYAAGLSSNTKFEVLGTGSSNATGGPMGATTESATISEVSFTNALYFKGTGNKSGEIPTSRGIKFITPSAGTLDIYVKGPGSINIVKEGGTGSAIGAGDSNAKVSVEVTAGTYYLYATASSRTLFGIKLNCCSDPVINEGSTKTSFAGGSWPQNSGHTITITATGADSYEWYRNTSATDAGATKLSETSNTLDITAGVAAGTYFYKAIAKSGACSSSTEWGWCGAMTITAVTYSITYNCNGAESGCPSNVAAASNLPNPLPTGLTKDGYDFVGWYTNSTKTVAAVAGAALSENTTLYAKWTEHVTSECITITDFETSNHSKSDNKPDSEGKYFYGYKGTKDAAHAVTITATNGDCIGVNSGAELKVYAGKYVNIYADNTTTGGTPATFSNVTSVSIDAKMINSSYYTTFDIKVGETTIADDVSLVDAKSSYQTFTYDGLAQLSGKIKIINNGSGSSYNFYADNIQICTADMDACTTPTIPDLSNQSLCSGAAAAAWNATVSNAATIEAAGESVAYKWQKKNGSNWDDISGATTATYDVDGSGTVTEAMEGTYRVVVTVSKAGKSSTTANKEVTLSVTEGTEVTGITADKATVYPGNSVTLTATANTPATWQWYTCTSAEGAGAAIISGAESASYTIAGAGAAGTYYYKAVATGSCGTAERVYTLTVTAASECQNYYWFIYADDATANGVINNRDGFFSNTTTGTGNTGTYTMTVDGVSMTGTKRLSTGAYKPKFTVPAGATATLYIYGKAASADAGKHLVLKRTSDDEEVEVTSNTTVQGYTKENIEAGEWTLSCGSSNWCYSFFAVKVCSTSSCTDATPTIAAVNNTVCSGTKMRIDATGYETGATFKWQKLNTSTSSWDDVAGATLDSLVIASVTASNAGSYRFIATKECARTSNTVTISVPSAPNFGSTVPASVSVMQTIALSINTVEATDATKYRWYKSADPTWDAGDVEIGTNKELIKAYDSEAIGSPSYYIFCRAQNACGITTSDPIAVNVTTYVEEDCATRGNEGDAEFSFENSGAGQGSYESTACWTMNSNSKILVYYPPTGKYFKTAKVTIASSSESKASYNWSTNGGTDYTAVSLTVNSTLTERTINLSTHGNVNAFQIGRNFDSKGSSSGTLYVSKICFEYTDACTATTVTPSTASTSYEMGGAWSNPTFTLSVAGTLTYSSSNEDIASVDDDGTVTFNGEAGTVTITASYAGGTISETEYCASSGSYTITVSCSGGAPKVVASGASVDCNSSITLQAKTQSDGDFADGTYQWFRNGEEIDGATSSSYTATQAGTYTVERTNASDCTTPSTNSAVVTSETTEPEVERLVPFQYYHVDKTYSDQMKMRHLFAVKNSGKLDGKSFKMYVSRNGGAATDVTSSNALVVWPNGDGHVDTVMVDLNKLSGKYEEDDELVFTCKAIDCTPAVSETYKATITMHVIDTDTATLALICSGSSKAGGTRKTGELTVGGDFLTGYNVADLCQQTGNTSFDGNTEWGLYTDLKTQYIVTPVNGYAVFNKLNYEPFDILLLTDYPKASKSDAAADVLDDMAALCDYRPMLSFKTHMVAKSPSKWAEKGFTTSPVVTKADGRLNLNIVCYAHPMFEGLKSGDDVYTDVGNTSAPLVYTMLTGTGFESSKGMQGFELAAAENFITIGLTHYNGTITKDSPDPGEVEWTPGSEDRMLVTVAERQANPEARFILFSLNCGAQSKLTDKGEEVVLACLNYLLGTAEGTIEPADCSFTFDNGENNEHNAAWYTSNCPLCTGTKGDGLWTTAANWGPDYRLLPGEFTSVRIKKPVEVNDEHAHVMEVRIIDGGSVDIPAGKALDVKSTIRRMDGSEIYPTEEGDIHIGSASTGNGTLIFNNDEGDTKARVDMYSNAQADIANMSAATSVWQYIGTPHTDVANARSNYYGSWLYQYSGSGWEVIPNGGPLVAFRGYCITNETAPVVYDMAGTLAATTSQDIAIPARYTVIANSWTAPIDINAITDDDMEGISDKSIYFFNTGSDAEGNHGTGTEAGTYRTTPIHSASYTGDWQIPSMQGFYISTETAGTLHLDYERHVRPHSARTVVGNPMYAPKRATAESDEPAVLKIFARGSRYQDKLVVLEREDFTRGYDSGWDGEAWGGGTLSPMVYVIGEGREDAVSAIPEFEGTVIAFKAGEDDAYTLHFEYLNSDEPLYLLDTENNTYTQVITGNAYYFTTTDKAAHSRFILTRKAPQIATGTELTSDGEGAKARKLLIEDKMYILLNGMLYDATGKVVK